MGRSVPTLRSVCQGIQEVKCVSRRFGGEWHHEWRSKPRCFRSGLSGSHDLRTRWTCFDYVGVWKFAKLQSQQCVKGVFCNFSSVVCCVHVKLCEMKPCVNYFTEKLHLAITTDNDETRLGHLTRRDETITRNSRNPNSVHLGSRCWVHTSYI